VTAVIRTNNRSMDKGRSVKARFLLARVRVWSFKAQTPRPDNAAGRRAARSLRLLPRRVKAKQLPPIPGDQSG
jgi:hypothetical protein